MRKISHKIGNEARRKSFHRFPELSSPVGQKWVEFVRSKILDPNWTPERKHKLCSRHFTEDCFIKNAIDKPKTLKDNAIPTKLILPQKNETLVDDHKNVTSNCVNTAPALHGLLTLPDDKHYLKGKILKLRQRIAKVEKQAINRFIAINSQQERGRKLEKIRDEIMSKLMVNLQKEYKSPKHAKL